MSPQERNAVRVRITAGSIPHKCIHSESIWNRFWIDSLKNRVFFQDSMTKNTKKIIDSWFQEAVMDPALVQIWYLRPTVNCEIPRSRNLLSVERSHLRTYVIQSLCSNFYMLSWIFLNICSNTFIAKKKGIRTRGLQCRNLPFWQTHICLMTATTAARRKYTAEVLHLQKAAECAPFLMRE